ncbi:MAG: DUF4258 domain-containing protein [Acidobacteriia bacterium]|nr:DUF4258 domain-containing protein [Terriglobia bacterium]
MKTLHFAVHAREQCEERGATQAEVKQAIEDGVREPAKRGRFIYRLNFQYNAEWQGKFYAIKQVAPVVVEAQNEMIVVTVYTFYF